MGHFWSCHKSSSSDTKHAKSQETSFAEEEERRKSRHGEGAAAAGQRRRRRSSGLSQYSNDERHVVEAPLRIAAFNVRRYKVFILTAELWAKLF